MPNRAPAKPLGEPGCGDAAQYGADREQAGPVGRHLRRFRQLHAGLAGEEDDGRRLVDRTRPQADDRDGQERRHGMLGERCR
jgi:hypothetical protein